MDAAPFHEGCCWSWETALGTSEWCSLLQGCLNPQGCCTKKYIYTSGSWSFNLSNSELAEAWFVQSIQWPLRLRRTSIWVIMSTHQNSLHDQSTQLKEWWLGLEPMIYWHSCAEKKIWRRTGERESGLTVLEKMSTWDASVSEGVWGMYLFASTHI